ncbi:MAG: 50S ribosomal protein L25 [Ignavibacteria bacterium]|nr:50S ribosomal protein L25 [Ignavibacteria bacterium]
MSEINLKAKKREEYKESTLNQIRKKGVIPGIYYGHGVDSISLAATEIDLRPIIYTTESHIVNLSFDGDSSNYSCILKDVQFHPVTDKPLHFDLIALKEGETLTIEVSVHLIGNPQGVRDGGTIQHILHKLEIECLPSNIPSHIDIEISHLNMNDSIKVSDLKLENIKVLNDENASIVAVVPPTVEKVVTPEEGAETPAEPEVISKAKKDDEEKEK